MKSIPDRLIHKTDEMLKRTLFAVEATSFEQFTLWEHHAKGSLHRKFNPPLNWEQMSPGWMEQVGSIGRCPCMIEVSWAEIEGQLILFWHSCSAVTDSRQAEAWMRKHFTKKYDNGTRLAMTDAQNFGHCLSAIKEANLAVHA